MLTAQDSKSAKKHALAALTNYLCQLEKKYLIGSAATDFSRWPTAAEINQITKLTKVVYLGSGRKAPALHRLGDMYEQIDKQHRKVGLKAFTDALLSKLEKMELSPYFRVKSALKSFVAKTGEDTSLLQILEDLFPDNCDIWGQPFASIEEFSACGSALFYRLLPFSSPEFHASLKRPSSLPEMDYNKTRELFIRNLAWGAYVDIVIHQRAWNSVYKLHSQEPSQFFIWLWQNDDYNSRLLQRFYLTLPGVTRYQTSVEQLQTNHRQKKCRS